MRRLFLYLDETPLGELSIDSVRGRETWMFRFDDAFFLKDFPVLDPALAPVRGPQFPQSRGCFGFLTDVAPDRWGRKLIRRREKRDLRESDYLLGVCDLTRMGALRLKEDADGPFVAADLGDAAPPWTTLRKLEEASAMTMLGVTDGEDGHSYLEIAEWICANSADATADLHELWSRMAFSQLVRNTDDHLRNHGFLLTEKGWRLSPLFDVNPNPGGGESALDRGDLFADAAYYRLTRGEAQTRYSEMKSIVDAAR